MAATGSASWPAGPHVFLLPRFPFSVSPVLRFSLSLDSYSALRVESLPRTNATKEATSSSPAGLLSNLEGDAIVSGDPQLYSSSVAYARRTGCASVDGYLCVPFGHVALVVGLIVALHGRGDHDHINGDVIGLAGHIDHGVGDIL